MFGGSEGLRPAALVEYCPARHAWIATAVIAIDGEPLGVEGASTSEGASPAMALDNLLGRMFSALTPSCCPASMVSIDREVQPS